MGITVAREVAGKKRSESESLYLPMYHIYLYWFYTKQSMLLVLIHL